MNANRIYMICIIVLCFYSSVQAASLPTSDTDSKAKIDLKNPTDWLELSGDFRFRFQYDNAIELEKEASGHDRVFTRYRIREQGKIKLTEDIDFNIRFVFEPRYYGRPDTRKNQLAYHEGLFDKFNLTFRNAFNLPLTIVIGRQELKFGTGWLISDGTPSDGGGRTGYFDAMRFTYNLQDDTTADFVWVQNHADSAKWLKPFNDKDIDIAEQDEQGAILYFTQKTSKDSGRELYLIYKHDTDRKSSSGSEGEIYTLGFRKYGRLNEHWGYSMEFAPQFGHKNGKSLGAFATNNQLVYYFNDEKQNEIYLGYEYLSGNDDTDKNFDRGWARRNSWSWLYQGNIDAIDGREYDNANLHRLYIDWATKLTKNIDMKTGYALLFADDNTNAGGTGGLSKSGNFRGQLVCSQLKIKYAKNIEQVFEGNVFFPGDFYNKDKNDIAVYAKTDVIFTW